MHLFILRYAHRDRGLHPSQHSRGHTSGSHTKLLRRPRANSPASILYFPSRLSQTSACSRAHAAMRPPPRLLRPGWTLPRHPLLAGLPPLGPPRPPAPAPLAAMPPLWRGRLGRQMLTFGHAALRPSAAH
eukprot:403052-Prorocentrum_minimum.AAC.2